MFTDIYTKLELDIKEYVIALSKYIHHISLIMDFALMKFNINEDIKIIDMEQYRAVKNEILSQLS